jgi:transposase
MARLEDVPIDALRSELQTFDEHRPILRLLAAILYQTGSSVPEIAKWLDVREATVYAWFDRLEGTEDLGEAVKDRQRPGRPPKLSPGEREAALRHLALPPSAAGFDATEWNPELAGRYLADEFAVDYSPRHVRRLLTETGNGGV